MGRDWAGRLGCESVRCMRDGARFFGDLVHVPFMRRALRVCGMVDTCSCALSGHFYVYVDQCCVISVGVL